MQQDFCCPKIIQGDVFRPSGAAWSVLPDGTLVPFNFGGYEGQFIGQALDNSTLFEMSTVGGSMVLNDPLGTWFGFLNPEQTTALPLGVFTYVLRFIDSYGNPMTWNYGKSEVINV